MAAKTRAPNGNLVWMLLLAAILIGLAAGTWGAVRKIDYSWRWNRVPQYFLYKAEIAKKIPFDGRVEAVIPKGGKISVRLVSEDNETATVTVDKGYLSVSQGDEMFQGDTVGYVHHWRLGPLTLGLWTTLWISAVASVMALLIGLLTGLCRISKNLTLRGLAAIYVEFIRGTPLLVQIFIAYFFVGTVFNLNRNVAGVESKRLCCDKNERESG